MDLPQIDNYQQLFVDDIPLLDVRAPVEFKQGAFPQAKNIPLMNDEERHTIGIRYKEQGQEQAIALGHELVSGDIKADRVERWADFTRQYPQGALYCFRGGMRSKITQQWLYDKTGVIYPRVKGGYKALRRFLINELDKTVEQTQFIILCGRTGAGKTLVLNKMTAKIDLEGIYKHRGSAFGKCAEPQPSQIDVENNLTIELLKQRSRNQTTLVLEDEGSNIGSRYLPESISLSIKQSPLVMLETSPEQRIENVFEEYIIKDLAAYQAMYGNEQGFDTWAINLLAALDRIQKRLGGVRYKALKMIMEGALQQQRNGQGSEQHKDWIQGLLTDYYDPMYDYQLAKKSDRLVFTGNEESVLQYINEQLSG